MCLCIHTFPAWSRENLCTFPLESTAWELPRFAESWSVKFPHLLLKSGAFCKIILSSPLLGPMLVTVPSFPSGSQEAPPPRV